MTRIEIAKAIANHAIGYSIGAASVVFFRQNRSHSDNKAIEFAIDVSTFLAVIAVSGTVRKPVRIHTEDQIDAIVAWWNENVTNRP